MHDNLMMQVSTLPAVPSAALDLQSHWQLLTCEPMQGTGTGDPKPENRIYLRFDQPQSLLRPKLLTWSALVGRFEQGSGADEQCSFQATVLPQTSRRSLSQPPGKADEPQMAGAGLAATASRTASAAEPIRERYAKLLVEAAHDLRAPIATSRQLISTVARRLRVHATVTQAELQLLDLADQRLGQASCWASEILSEERLSGEYSIRKRFYPQQWQALVRSLFHSVAAEHNVRLLWIGWERSLPKLYLDPSQLSRAILNLVLNACQASYCGGQVTIRASWPMDMRRRLIIEVDDQGPGLDRSLMSQINSPLAAGVSAQGHAPGITPRGDYPLPALGVGLRTVQSLAGAMGAEIAAVHGKPTGTSFRLLLPTDDLKWVLREWFWKNRSVTGQSGLQTRCEVYGIRLAKAINPVQADSCIQRWARLSKFVYRISHDRWLLFSMGKMDEQTIRARGAFTADLSLLNSLDTELHRELGVSGTIRSFLLARSSALHASRGRNDSELRSQCLEVADRLFEQIRSSIGDSIPPIDDLHHPLETAVVAPEPLKQPSSRPMRVDLIESVNGPHIHNARQAPSFPVQAGRGLRELDALADTWKRTQTQLSRTLPVHRHARLDSEIVS